MTVPKSQPKKVKSKYGDNKIQGVGSSDKKIASKKPFKLPEHLSNRPFSKNEALLDLKKKLQSEK